jgi:hypothetical protein
VFVDLGELGIGASPNNPVTQDIVINGIVGNPLTVELTLWDEFDNVIVQDIQIVF